MKKCFTVTVLRSTEQIEKAEELLVKTGIYKGCEIFYPYEVSDEVYNTYSKNIERFTKYPDFDMVMHLPYGPKNNHATYVNLDATMQRLKDAIDYSARYNIKGLTLHPGHVDSTMTRDEAFNLSVKNTQILCDYAKKYGMTIMLENMVHEDELCLTIEEMKKYHELANRDNLGITLDCGHYHASHQTTEPEHDLVKYVETFKDKLAHLHLHDNHGERDEHLKIGEGKINFADYFKALEKANFKGLYGSEVLFKDYAELLDTAKKIDEYHK